MLGPVGQRQLAPALAALLVAVAGCSEEDFGRGGASTSARVPPDAARATLTKHTDGDTFYLSGIGKVRLIGIDTPEVYGERECFGREASRFVERTVPVGARVRYRLGVEERDRYGRALAYVWLRDGRFLNRRSSHRGSPSRSPSRRTSSTRTCSCAPPGVHARPAAGSGAGPAAPGRLPGVLERVTTPDGVEIGCEVSGQGPPLVLVHGAGSARWGFGALRPLLEDRFTVIAVDRRGRGGLDGRRRLRARARVRGRGGGGARRRGGRRRAAPVRPLLRGARLRRRGSADRGAAAARALRAADGRRARRAGGHRPLGGADRRTATATRS